MKLFDKKNLRRGLLLTALLILTGAGIRLAVRRSAAMMPDAVPAAAQHTDTPVIVLDAGHGGIDGGCSTADGVPEKGINLSILLTLRDLLRMSGYEVQVTRDTDRSIHDRGIEGIANQKSSDMDNRLAILNAPEHAVCVSIHQNQFTDPRYSGAQMFFSDTNPQSEGLAQLMQTQFQMMLQPTNSREIKRCGKELFLCYYCHHPMVMAECGFLSNPEEAALLVTEEYRQKVAFTIFAALSQWLAGNSVQAVTAPVS
ncbi:MAG: N-acetylmuramoyl-L-alanine amidase [Oscillospiraceae bacterium]|nr:N-acetylmuramoyl-L-alanine amidase [Oscillospiraceae bacterium]